LLVVLADGAAVTCTVQLPAGARLEQSFVCEKSAALAPVIAMELIVIDVDPLFVIVTGWAADVKPIAVLGNAMEEGVICWYEAYPEIRWRDRQRRLKGRS